MPAGLRTALWALTYLVALVVSRRLVVEPRDIPLVAPASGVALVWLASSGNRRALVLDVTVLVVVTVVTIGLTDGTVAQALLGGLAPLQALTVIALLRRWTPQLWGAGGRHGLHRLSELGLVLAAMLVGVVTYTVVRTPLGVLLVDDEALRDGLSRLVRGFSALSSLGLFGLLLGGWLAERRDARRPTPNTPPSDLANLAGALLATAVIFYFGFSLHPHAPSTFILTLPTVWVAIRCHPVLTSAYCLVSGAVGVALTIANVGPIAQVSEPVSRATIAQVFVVVLMVVGVVIGLNRRQVLDTVADLEQSQAAVAMRANELDLVMAHLDDGVAIIEEGGRIVHANTALRTAFGTRPASEADQMPGPDETPEELRLRREDGVVMSEEVSPLTRALAGETVPPELYRNPAEGSVEWVEISAVPLRRAPGAPGRAMLVIRDVTSQQAERDALAQFARTVAHDLNNPLMVLSGWAEALGQDFQTAPAVPSSVGLPMVDHIAAASDRMRELISDLLARAVAHDQRLQPERVSLHDAAVDVRAAHRAPGSDAEQVELGPLPDVWADPGLVRQLLENLIGNAFKYVAAGVVPHVRLSGVESDGWATVRVQDNGIGIAPEDRLQVFETFHRATRGGYDGTGLGLAICKRIVERHGGSIQVTDNPDGIGSCFELTLPTTTEALAAAAPPTLGPPVSTEPPAMEDASS